VLTFQEGLVSDGSCTAATQQPSSQELRAEEPEFLKVGTGFSTFGLCTDSPRHQLLSQQRIMTQVSSTTLLSLSYSMGAI